MSFRLKKEIKSQKQGIEIEEDQKLFGEAKWKGEKDDVLSLSHPPQSLQHQKLITSSGGSTFI